MRPLRALVAIVAARWPAARGSLHDAAREEQRRALARFLAAPAVQGGAVPGGAPGFAGTPGIGDAIEGQRRALADPPDHAGAAEAFFRALRAIPDVDDEATDASRQARLAQALTLMLLAHHAVKAGLVTRRWGRFGTAAEAAAQAVACQPLQLYLRFEQAEVLRLLGLCKEAFAALGEALPLATDLASRFRLADTAGEIAVQAAEAEGGDAALLEAAERVFIEPLLDGRDGPAAPPEAETAARDWAWWVAFRAGKLALTRARRDTTPGGAAGLAEAAARRFSRGLALIEEAATAVAAEHRANLAEWRQQALREAAERHLAAGAAADAARALAAIGTGDSRSMADAISAWLAAGRPARLAAAALLRDGTAEGQALAIPALAEATRIRREEASHALPPLAEPVVIAVNDPLLMDEDLAQAIIGGEETPTIADLRERLRARFRFRLPGVRLRGVDDPEAPRRISVIFAGKHALSVTAPAGAVLAFAAPEEVRLAGLMPLGDAPAVNGVACTWVAAPAASAVVALRDPAYAIVGTLETAVLRSLPRLIGLDDAATMLPGLAEAELPRALATLRLLLGDRMGLDDAVVEHLRAALAAGEAPRAILRDLRLMPGVRAQLWGNEGWRRAVRLAEPPSGPGLAEAVASAIGAVRDATLIVPFLEQREALRAALAPAQDAHAWLADVPVLTVAEWTGPA
jgi:hypothetical protein